MPRNGRGKGGVQGEGRGWSFSGEQEKGWMKGLDTNTRYHSPRSDGRCLAAQEPSRCFPRVEDRVKGFTAGLLPVKTSKTTT